MKCKLCGNDFNFCNDVSVYSLIEDRFIVAKICDECMMAVNVNYMEIIRRRNINKEVKKNGT